MKISRKIKTLTLAALCAGISVVIAACYGAYDMEPADDDDSAATDDDDSSQ